MHRRPLGGLEQPQIASFRPVSAIFGPKYGPSRGQLVSEWLLRRLAESGEGQKAWPFLLEGLQTRLRHGLRGPGLDAARRDLRNLQQAASKAMLRLLQVARDAPEAEAGAGGAGKLVDNRGKWREIEENSEILGIFEGKHGEKRRFRDVLSTISWQANRLEAEGDRFFWLSQLERRQCAELGEKCAEDADAFKRASGLRKWGKTLFFGDDHGVFMRFRLLSGVSEEAERLNELLREVSVLIQTVRGPC